jgi:hypothetical protein
MHKSADYFTNCNKYLLTRNREGVTKHIPALVCNKFEAGIYVPPTARLAHAYNYKKTRTNTIREVKGEHSKKDR